MHSLPSNIRLGQYTTPRGEDRLYINNMVFTEGCFGVKVFVRLMGKDDVDLQIVDRDRTLGGNARRNIEDEAASIIDACDKSWKQMVELSR